MGLFEFDERSIWVIEGTGYLGQSTVKMLLESGANVLCADLDNKAEDFGIPIKEDDKFIPVSIDVRDEKEIESFVRENIRKYGIPDGLVILTFGASGKSLEELSGEDLDMATHMGLTATFLFSRAVAIKMVKEGQREYHSVFELVWHDFSQSGNIQISNEY